MYTNTVRRQLTIGLLWATAGCGVSFPENHLIEDLRVLNIRAEPPEVALFVGGGLELEPLPSFATSTVVRFTVLAAHPDLDAKLRFDWFRCAPDDPSDAPLRGLPCDASARCCALQPSTSSQNGSKDSPVWNVSLRGTGFIAQLALRESRT